MKDDGIGRAIVTIWIVGALVSLTGLGVGIWATIELVKWVTSK